MNMAAYIPKRDGKKQSLCSVFLVDEGLASGRTLNRINRISHTPDFPGSIP